MSPPQPLYPQLAGIVTLPNEVLLEIRSYIPDLFTNVSLSQTCRRLRYFYDDSDNHEDPSDTDNRPGFFECALRKIGLNRSMSRPDGKDGPMPGWRALASAVVFHSTGCSLSHCTDAARTDLRDLPMPSPLNTMQATSTNTELRFNTAANLLRGCQFENAGNFCYRLKANEVNAHPRADMPELSYFRSHITAASRVVTCPAITALLITAKDVWDCGIDESGVVANPRGVTCFDAIQCLCNILTAQFDPTRREMAITRHYYEQNDSMLSLPDIRDKYEKAEKISDVFPEARFFAGFYQGSRGKLSAYVHWSINDIVH